jgi:hypothetical protein
VHASRRSRAAIDQSGRDVILVALTEALLDAKAVKPTIDNRNRETLGGRLGRVRERETTLRRSFFACIRLP